MNTPRTDAFMESGPLQRPTLSELADFARQLETELQIMTALAEKLAEVLATCSVKDWFKTGDSDEVVVTLNADKVRKSIAAYESHKKQKP